VVQQQLPPAVMKVVLGNELARQRTLAGVTQIDAAAVLRCTQQKIAHIEAGSGIRAIELDALLDRYGTEADDRRYAQDLQAESNRRTKRGAFSTRFPQYLRLLVDMEPSCQRLFAYQTMVVPGLLQTEEYMRALFRSWRASPLVEQIEESVANRLLRQRVLDDTEQSFRFVIDEAALRRTPGGSPIMRNQIDRLIEITARPNVEIQIVPFDTGYYSGQGCDYTIFGFDTRPPVDVVYLEQHDGGQYLDNNARTATYLRLFEQVRAVAVGPEQTPAALLDIAVTV